MLVNKPNHCALFMGVMFVQDDILPYYAAYECFAQLLQSSDLKVRDHSYYSGTPIMDTPKEKKPLYKGHYSRHQIILSLQC